MNRLYVIKDDSANQVVSMYFVAQSDIEAIRQFKGFVNGGNYPAFPKELSLYQAAEISDDGSLCVPVNFSFNFSDSKQSYIGFELSRMCTGDNIESAYVNFSVMTEDDFDSMKVSKNVTEAEFDEEQKNGDFGR